jgi:hypothetical protein
VRAQTHKPLEIDLSDIDMEEVKLFIQEGGRGTPEMAASCGCASCAAQFCISCGAGGCNTGFED